MESRRFLMCPPRFFAVAYEINPWMHTSEGANQERAMEQWLGLRRLYEERGCTVEVLEPQVGMPDLVFTANAAFVHDGQVLLSRFRFAQRRPEEPVFAAYFREGFRLAPPLPEGVAFEGQGEAFVIDGILFAGHGFRAVAASHAHLARAYARRVVSLELVDPRFYHLDTCFCPLPGGRLLYFPGAFTEASRARVEAELSPDQRLAVSQEDALDFVCNSVPIGSDFVTGSQPSPELLRRLREWGLEVVSTPLGEFKKAGGGARCLTLALD